MRYQLRYIRIAIQFARGIPSVRDTGIEPVTSSVSGKRSPAELNAPTFLYGTGADDETRTRDPHLGKVMRYQLRYIRTLSTLSALNARTNFILTTPVPTNRHVITPFLSLLLNRIVVIPVAGGGAFVMRLPRLTYRGSIGVMTSGFGSFGCGV